MDEKKVGQLIELRRQKIRLQDEFEGYATVFKEEHSTLIEQLETTRNDIAQVEAEIRALGVEEYKATGEKKLAHGIGIRIIRRLIYSPSEALEWAIKHNIAVKLDKGSFEKVAKATKIDFVTTNEEAQTTIPNELFLDDEEALKGVRLDPTGVF